MLGCRFGRQRLVVLIALIQVYVIQVSAIISEDENTGPLKAEHYANHWKLNKNNWKVNTGNSEEEEESNTKEYTLFNLCSNRLLQILGKNAISKKPPLNAQGTRDDSIFARLLFKTISFGEIRIQSWRSKYYLCFSRKGKLIIRRNGNNPRCTFREIKNDKNTETKLQSVANEKWFVGFRKNGKPLKGMDVINTRKAKCFKFYKREILADGVERTSDSHAKDIQEGPFSNPKYLSIYSSILHSSPRKKPRWPRRTDNT